MESTRKTTVTVTFTQKEANILYNIVTQYFDTAVSKERDFIRELLGHIYFS